eukprot:226227-Chlamydomonas_euryale.AAC.1
MHVHVRSTAHGSLSIGLTGGMIGPPQPMHMSHTPDPAPSSPCTGDNMCDPTPGSPCTGIIRLTRPPAAHLNCQEEVARRAHCKLAQRPRRGVAWRQPQDRALSAPAGLQMCVSKVAWGLWSWWGE